MIRKDEKQQDLNRLERFVLESDIKDYVSHKWYNSLRFKYPFEYIQLLKKHKNSKNDTTATKVEEERISDAINWIWEIYIDLNKYIIEPPEEDEQKTEFVMLITRLEALLLKQNKEN